MRCSTSCWDSAGFKVAVSVLRKQCFVYLQTEDEMQHKLLGFSWLQDGCKCLEASFCVEMQHRSNDFKFLNYFEVEILIKI